MTETKQRTVGEVVAEHPAAARIFEKYQIDFCCNGKRPLDEVCAEKGIDAQELSSEIGSAASGSTGPEREWQSAPLHELIGHIVASHHEYLRGEMPWIAAKLDKLVEKHGERHPFLVPLRNVFASLAGELDGHMRKEEMILFPFIIRIEKARLAGQRPIVPPFGPLSNPISVMEIEHNRAGEALREIHELTSGYATPADGCATFRATMDALARLETDLHTHIHLENNILHPRAIALQ